MNRAQVKEQLALMRAGYDADIAALLAKLSPGRPDANLAILDQIEKCAHRLAQITVADAHADQVPEVDPAAPAPAPTPPPAPVVGGKAGWPTAALEKIIHKKTVR